MPEAPEMQGLAERLDTVLAGTTFGGLVLLQFNALKTVTPAASDLVGCPVVSVGRRGKYCVIELEGGRIAFHLAQGGRVDLEDPPKATRPKPGVARLAFDGGPSVLIKEFGTERSAGVWFLAPDDDGPMERLGPEADSDDFRAWVLDTDDTRRVHTVLRDQRTVAGLGRGLADDIVWHARLSPYASMAKLDGDQRRALLAAVATCVAEALDAERQRRGGLPTKLEGRFIVHRRHGEACPRCGEIMGRVSYESHEVTYCPACQTGGKVLADRRLSRLLK